MSAPSLACDLFDAIGPLLQRVQDSLGCKASLEWFAPDDKGAGFYCAILWDHGRAFQGLAKTPTQALLKANSDRQDFADIKARATQGDA